MNAKTLVLVSIIYISFFTAYSQCDQWVQKADFGGIPREQASGFSIGGKVYIGTGWGSGSDQNDFWEYDPTLDTWTQKTDFGGTPRHEAVGFSIDGKGYIGTGQDSDSTRSDFWEYDPALDTWTRKADFGGTARRSAIGFAIGAKGYIGTGWDGSPTVDFWEYDPALDTWTQKTDFGGTGRYAATGFSIGAKGYIGTGWDGSPTVDFWEYDTTSNIWNNRADFGGTARYAAVGFSIGAKGYIGTGNGGGVTFWQYAPLFPLASFTYTQSTYDFTFNNSSINATNWFWNFGDGDTDTVQNPVHTYADTGTYIVCLIATNTCSADTFCDTITVCAAMVAGFIFTDALLTVNFTDSSTGNITNWHWTFGDGDTDTIQNPLHTYADDGTYIVCMTTINNCSTDTFCDTITVCAAMIAGFTFADSVLTVNFTDISTGNAANWLWNFGDGNTDTVQNPVHTYADTGNYIVCMTTINPCGADSICDSVSVMGVGIERLEDKNQFMIYPNPAHVSLSIILPKYFKIKNVSIYNIVGQKVLYQQDIDNLNVSSLKPGLYLLLLKGVETSFTARFVKE